MDKYTYEEGVALLNGLRAVSQHRGLAFAVPVAKNIKALETEFKILTEKSKPSEEFLELVKGMTPEEIAEQQEKATGKAKKLFEQREKEMEAFEDFLQSECPVKLLRIPESALPRDLNGAEYRGIMDLIIADKQEPKKRGK